MKPGKKLLERNDRTIQKTPTKPGRVQVLLDSMEKTWNAWSTSDRILRRLFGCGTKLMSE